jgi:2-polyprenyl-3-methyl-5-hydroxy-6-metoxy-1,4-benzoquinol methylase
LSTTTRAGSDDERRLFFERYASEYDRTLNKYDVARRTEVIFDELAVPGEMKGRMVLDLGCATGWLSERAAREGATVVAVDLGPRLVSAARARAKCAGVIADMTALPFREGSFDFVINPEVIEHVQDQASAVTNMARVLKPGGSLLLTTPNRPWLWVITLATRLKLRPYEGIENWISLARLRKLMAERNLVIEKYQGFNLFWPFSHVIPGLPDKLVASAYNLERRVGPHLRLLALNVALRARKRESRI